ncbi:hypothetical protein HDU98_008158 [Podochytrium sp. JEL0797]|nr:hypothetical protein HDU98_008158 [Podochytrium sp. JEL0797]
MVPDESAQHTRFVTLEWPDVENINEKTRNELCNFSEKESRGANYFSMDYDNPYNNNYNVEAEFASMPKIMDVKVTMKAAHGAKAKTPTFVMAATTLELPVTRSGNHCHIFPLSGNREFIYIKYQVRIRRGEVLEDERPPASFLVSMMVFELVTHCEHCQISLSIPKSMPWYRYLIW